MSPDAADLRHREGDYGFDAPYVLLVLGAVGVMAVIVGVAIAFAGSTAWAKVSLAVGLYLLMMAGSFAFTTRRGKFDVWAKLLLELDLKGDEHVLDMGSGRGAILMMVAQLVPRGRAVGLDLWVSSDQSGNSLAAAKRNADLEGVADRVELRTADMTSMPFDDASFDIVLSALAIHNIKDAGGRKKAIDEAVRVLKPGGRLRIADFRSTHEYVGRLRQLGIADSSERSLGWRYWYGGPWAATKLVTASKPRLAQHE